MGDHERRTGTRTSTHGRRAVLKTSAGALAAALTGSIGAVGADGRERGATDHSFLFWNAWLLDGIEVLSFDIAGKPQYGRRAGEIGRALAETGYDIVALAEVFDRDEREAIRSNMTGTNARGRVGPHAGGLNVSSGLYTLLTGDESERSFVDSDAVVYDDAGERLCDADAWASKGALHTEIDVGPGAIDLFSTHLFAGGGLPTCTSDGGASRDEVRRRQIEQLTDFVRERSRPENVTVVTGDFNVDAASDQHRYVEAMQAELGLYDAWVRHGGDAGGTDDEAFGDGCPVDPGADLPYYCDDEDPDAVGAGDRIDYVFVEEPTADHALELDVDRVRRASFWREKADPADFYAEESNWLPWTEDVPNYLSDHLALEMEFEAVPR